jgi:hypothetical protein
VVGAVAGSGSLLALVVVVVVVVLVGVHLARLSLVVLLPRGVVRMLLR